MKLEDKILSARRGDGHTAFAYLDQPDAKDDAYIDALWRWCGVAGVDFAIAYCWFLVETADATSIRWNRDLNPGGVGIPSDSTVQPFVIANGDEAARIHVQCLYSMVKKEWHPGVTIPLAAAPWFQGVWLPKVTDPKFPRVERLTDLDVRYEDSDGDLHATWAWGFQLGQPAQAAVNKSRLVFPRLPDQTEEQPSMGIPTTHSKPKPTIYNLATDYARFGLEKWQADEIIGSRFPNRNGGRPRAIGFHIQAGRTTGSLDYWSSDAIDASSTVMTQKDGSILKIVPEQHGPWTNGDVMAPTPQANELLALGGNPNNWTLTNEVEGQPFDQMPRVQHDAIVWQAEDWIMRYPEILELEYCLIRHGWINSINRPNCPGSYFDPVVADINAWLDGAATVPPPVPVPVEPPSIYPPGMTPELAKRLYGRVRVSWSSKTFEFHEGRSECQYWIARGKLQLKPGEDYTKADWAPIREVIRRGKTKNVHVYQWGDGDVYEKVIRKDQ